MNVGNKKDISIISSFVFGLFNLLHFGFVSFVLNDDLNIGILYVIMLHYASIPFITGQGIFYYFFRKVKYFSFINLFIFLIYILQIVLFYLVLLFS